MAKVKIVVIDIESGHNVTTLEREFENMNTQEAADEIREAVDMYTEAEEISDD